MNIKFYNNIFKELTFQQLLLADKVFPINEMKLQDNSSKKNSDLSTINYATKQKTKK